MDQLNWWKSRQSSGCSGQFASRGDVENHPDDEDGSQVPPAIRVDFPHRWQDSGTKRLHWTIS